MEGFAGTMISLMVLVCLSVFNSIEANLRVNLNDQRKSDGFYIHLGTPVYPDTEIESSISGKPIHPLPSAKKLNELRKNDWRSDESFKMFASNEKSQPAVKEDRSDEDTINSKVGDVPETISYQEFPNNVLHGFNKDRGIFPTTEHAAPGNQPIKVQQLNWNSNLPKQPFNIKPSKPIIAELNLLGIDSVQNSFADFSRIDDNFSLLTRKARHVISDPETTPTQENKHGTQSATASTFEIHDSQSKNETEAQMVLDLLKEGEIRLNSSSFPASAVLILGDTRSGKSMLFQFLTGDGENLISAEDVPGSGNFTISDNLGLIRNTSTITSWTVLPESMVDLYTNTTFYDCPGFSDTTGVARDIATTYFTKNLLKRLEKVKLIFTITHSSVRIGVDTQDFMTFAEHVTTVVKDVEKYYDSIALIVTKVENQYEKGALVPDKIVVESVAGFLKIVRAELRRKMQTNVTFTETKSKASSILKFIEVLLQKKGQSYHKIGIFRRPDKPGPLANVNSLRVGKMLIENLIHLNTKYATCNESDFGQTISSKSRNSLHTLVKKIIERISANVEKLQQNILKHFSSIEEQLNDFQYLYELFQRSRSTFSFTYETATSPSSFVQQVSHDLRDLNVSHSQTHLTSILKYDDYLTFCHSYGASRGKSSEWIYTFKPVIENFEETEGYYTFLVQLYDVLSSYNVQVNNKNFSSFGNNYFVRTNTSESQKRLIFYGLIVLRKKNVEISDNQLDNIKRLDVSSAKFKKLELLMEFALRPNVVLFCDIINRKLTVTGNFVKISDITAAALSVCQVSLIEIFALEKVFFDKDLDLTGKEAQVSVIAPTWESLGDRVLKLDGAAGTFEGPQSSCQSRLTPSRNGSAGNPGPPGYPAGSFFGVGRKFVNTQSLKISSVGGRGGPGQDGLHGTPGKNGSIDSKFTDEKVCWPKHDQCHDLWGRYSLQTCTVKGFECSDGTNGTDGGAGGKGGKSGQIHLIGTSPGDVALKVEDGENGTDGAGGNGGEAGRTGQGKTFKRYISEEGYDKRNPEYINEKMESWPMHKCAPGTSGAPGKNHEGAQEPLESRKLEDIAGVVNNFKKFARGRLNASVRQTHIQTFLNEYVGKLNLDGMDVIADDTSFENLS